VPLAGEPDLTFSFFGFLFWIPRLVGSFISAFLLTTITNLGIKGVACNTLIPQVALL